MSIEYNKLQSEANLSNTQASELFEVDISTIKRWSNGSVCAPRAVIMVLSARVSLQAKEK